MTNSPRIAVSVDFVNDPLSTTFTYVDLSARAWDFTCTRGHIYELAATDTTTGSMTLENIDGALDPTNPSSVYWPNVIPYRRVKVEAIWTGLTFELFNGFVQRWPLDWQDELTVSKTQIVDLFALLLTGKLEDVYTEEVKADAPLAFYPLSEGADSTTASDASGNNNAAATVAVSKYGAGTLTFGASAAGTQLPSGVALSSPDYNSTTTAARGTWLSIPSTVLPATGAFTIEMWVEGPATPPSNGAYLLSQRLASHTSLSSLQIDIVSGTGVVAVSLIGTAVNVLAGATNICDGGWHHVVLTESADGKTLTLYVDGVSDGVSTVVTATGWTNPGLPLTLGIDVSGVNIAFPIDATFGALGFYPTALTSGRVAAHYMAGKTAFDGDTADARIARLLGYAGWLGTTSLDACTTTVGPADVAGQSPLAAIQAVETTEGGHFLITKAGVPFYGSRHRRMQTTTPAFVFGDGGGTELPYESISFDFDPTYIYNEIELTRADGSSATATDPVSRYPEADYSASMLTVSTAELEDAADWLLGVYKSPHLRVSAITLHPGAVTSVDLWTACLKLNFGDRVTVNRRPKGSPHVISADYFVEQVIPTITPLDGTFELILSPIPIQALIADDPTYGVCDSTFVAAW